MNSASIMSKRGEIETHFIQGINVISNETLTGAAFYKNINNKLIADRLSTLFPQARIMVTIRNQHDLIESLHREHIRMGGTMTLNQFIGYRRGVFLPSYLLDDHTINPEMFNYVSLLKYYVGLFGAERVFVCPYEELLTNPRSFVKNILSFMGLTNVPDFKNVVHNRGYGSRQMRVARVFNRLLRSRLNPRGIIPEFNLPGWGRMNVKLLNRILQSEASFKILGRHTSANHEVKNALKERFREANEELSRMFNLDLENTYREYYFS